MTHVLFCSNAAFQVLFVHRKRSGLCNITWKLKNWSDTAKNECCSLWEKGYDLFYHFTGLKV